MGTLNLVLVVLLSRVEIVALSVARLKCLRTDLIRWVVRKELL